MSFNQPRSPQYEDGQDMGSTETTSEQQSFLHQDILSTGRPPQKVASRPTTMGTVAKPYQKISPDATLSSPMSPKLESGKMADSNITPRPAMDEADSAGGKGSNIPHWKPLWLRPSVTGSFAVVFAIVAATLISITRRSRNNGGLNDANDQLFYVWRFGPAACESCSF